MRELIGARLKEERERLGYSQTDFAALGGASKRSQIDWEKGALVPNAEFLATVAAVGVDVSYVLKGERIPPNAVSLDAARAAAGQAYKAAQALGGDLSVDKFEKLFVTLCDTTAAREEAAASSVAEPEVTGVHKVVQKIGAGSHNVQIGHGQLVASEAPTKRTVPRKKKSG